MTWLGQPLTRREDDRLLRGSGRFVNDVPAEKLLHLRIARADRAGAGLQVDTAGVQAMPGVVVVFTGADVAGCGAAAVNAVLPGMQTRPFRLLAAGDVTAVGEPVAGIVATSEAAAQDAAEALLVELTDAPAKASVLAEARFGAPFTPPPGRIVRVRSRHARVAAMPLEPRAALAIPDGDGLVVHLSTQTPHRARADLAQILALDEARIRVVAADVGGAFGAKASLHPEEALTALAALRLRQPVRWSGSRAEDLLFGTHGRGGAATAEGIFADDGRLLALQAELEFPLGAWTPYSAAVPGWNAARILPGPYGCAAVDVRLVERAGATAPIGIYRGAGRPEAALLMERLMEAAACELGLDPLELRRRNFAAPRRDDGDDARLLDAAAAAFGYPERRRELTARRAEGQVVGIGVASYIEPCGSGWESARISLEGGGRLVVAGGGTAQGQGRATAIAQLAAEALKTRPEEIDVMLGDTAVTPVGIGALASRSTPIGGSAVMAAAAQLIERARPIAARLLQADAATVEYCGRFRSGAATCSWAEIAMQESLSVEARYTAPDEAWAAGCCMALVSIETETGELRIERLVWADDAGRVVNPLLLEGQMVGGLAQGLGEALLERIVYDGDGQLLTGSLMDYALPRADDMPPVQLVSLPTPSRMNPLGAKGVGEAGCIGPPAAIVIAALDALRPYGIRELDMPLTAEKLWRALQEGKR